LVGQVSPKAADLAIEIWLRQQGASWEKRTTTMTDIGGTFSYTLTFPDDGVYEVKARHEGGKYTTENESPICNKKKT